MKLTSHILPILAALAAFAACGSRTSAPKPVDAWLEQSPDGPAGQLCVVDSLMWQQPDSALALLLDFAAGPQADSLDVFNGHYFQLLISELLYKNDYQQTNRPDLQRAVGYFDSLVAVGGADAHGVSVWPFQHRDASNASANTTAFLAARAHYINGVGYYERDSVVEACAEYLKTLETMEGHFAEKELLGHKARFMTYTYNRLGEMFSEQFMMEQAIECYKKTFAFNSIEPTSQYAIPNAYYQTGIQYDVLGKKDTAFAYYNQALEALPDTNNSFYRDICSSIALLNYQINHTATKSLKDLYWISSKASNYYEKNTRYLSIGSIYYLERQYDSALLYLEMVYKNHKDAAVRIQAAEYLLDIYQSMGNENKTSEYTTFLSQYAVLGYEQKAVQSQLANSFQNYQRRKAKIQNDIEKSGQRQRSILFLLFSFLVVISATVALYLKNRKNGERLKAQIKEVQSSHEIQQKALSGKLKKSKDELRELREQIGKQDDRGRPFSFAPSFKEEPVCRLIMERVNEGRFMSQMDCTVYKEYALSKEHLTELRKAADHHFNQFTVRISKAHPELTRLDLDYCCLYLLDLTDADISALMQRAYNTVNERNSKLRRIFGVDTSVAAALQAIANE